jgi:hypothetical protein
MAVKAMNEATEIRNLQKVMALSPTADSLDDIFVAPTAFVDGISFKYTGREIVIIRNTHASSPFTWTLKSVADALNRIGDIGPYSLAAGEQATILINGSGFTNANGDVTIVMTDNTVKVAVNRTPNQT